MSTATMTETKPAPGDLDSWKPNQEITEESRLFCAQAFGDIPVEIEFIESPVVVDRDQEGTHFRDAFRIIAIPGEKIRILLKRGATFADMTRAERLVRRLRMGWFLDSGLWEKRKRGDGYVNACYFEENADKKFSFEVRPCMDPACLEQWHSWDTRDGDEQNENCEGEAIRTDYYTVTLQREPGKRWEASAWQVADEFAGPAGLKALRDLVNDHAYLQGEADKINAAAGVA